MKYISSRSPKTLLKKRQVQSFTTVVKLSWLGKKGREKGAHSFVTGGIHRRRRDGQTEVSSTRLGHETGCLAGWSNNTYCALFLCFFFLFFLKLLFSNTTRVQYYYALKCCCIHFYKRLAHSDVNLSIISELLT